MNKGKIIVFAIAFVLFCAIFSSCNLFSKYKTVVDERAGHQLCEHSWKNADCISPKTCTLCGVTEGEALEHEWSFDDCTKGTICKNCDELATAPKDHTYEEGVCTSCGYKIYDYDSESKTLVIYSTVSAETERQNDFTIKLDYDTQIDEVVISDNTNVTVDMNGKTVARMQIGDGSYVSLVNSNGEYWGRVEYLTVGASTFVMNYLTDLFYEITLNSSEAVLNLSEGSCTKVKIVANVDGCTASQFMLPNHVKIFDSDRITGDTNIIYGELANGTTYYIEELRNER